MTGLLGQRMLGCNDTFNLNTLPPAEGRILDISVPEIFAPVFEPHRHKGLHGGRGSSKSHTYARALIARCLGSPGTRWLCVREIQKSLDQSVKRLLVDVIKLLDLESYFRVMRSEIITPGDGVIVFVGMNDVTKDNVKSFEGFDGAWVEEAQTFSQASLDLLRPTIRKPNSEIWFSWNPVSATDPVDAFLRGENLPPDSLVIRALWSDNPFFPEVLRVDKDYDFSRDVEKADHIWGGEYERNSEARIYKNWKVEAFETPADAAFMPGSDWGFAVDPTCMIRAFLDIANPRRLMVDFEAYKIGCDVDHSPFLFDTVGCTAAACPNIDWLALDIASRGSAPPTCTAPGHGMMRNWAVIADSARPETISYMKRHGYPRMEPSTKGPGSILEGIKFLQSFDIIVHPRCVRTIDELKNYKWKVDPLTGAILPIPRDKKNHVLDGLRYAAEKTRKAAKQRGGLVA